MTLERWRGSAEGGANEMQVRETMRTIKRSACGPSPSRRSI